MPHPDHPELRARRLSSCANASLQAEIERIRKMTVEQRILAALGMKSKFAGLGVTCIKEPPHESP